MNASMHQEVNTDDFIEGCYSKSADARKDREEEVAENHRPEHTCCRSNKLHLQLIEATTIDKACVKIKNSSG